MFRGDTHDYVKYEYPEKHWALDSTKEGTCIAFVKLRDEYINDANEHAEYNYAIKLNPTDRRGYRVLVTYVGDLQSDIQSTFNRPYSLVEQKGLSDVTTLMIEIYKKIGLPIVQTAQAGNNSHSFDITTGMIQIGNTKEPSMLHTHIWGRGNPQHEYILGVPLDGPKPGEMFDMMANTPHVPGNQKKVPWEANLLDLSLQVFKKTLQDYVSSVEFQKVFSKFMQVNIFQPEKIVEKTIPAGFYLQNNTMVDLTFAQQRKNHQTPTTLATNTVEVEPQHQSLQTGMCGKL